jgi:phospholipase C
MLVVSPFSRGGYVNSEVFDHTSQLRFIEQRFGVKAPNISAWRRSVTGDLTSTLGPTATTTVPALPATPQDDPVVGNECVPLQTTLEVNTPTPPYPIPASQTRPTQEPGKARRRPSRG